MKTSTNTQEKFFRLLGEALPDEVEMVIDKGYDNEGILRIQPVDSMHTMLRIQFNFQKTAQDTTTWLSILPGLTHYGLDGVEGVSTDYDGATRVYAKSGETIQTVIEAIVTFAKDKVGAL